MAADAPVWVVGAPEPEPAEPERVEPQPVVVEEPVLAYTVALVRATRDSPSVSLGVSPRGAAALLRARLRDPQASKLVATSLEHSPAFRAKKTDAGFDATVAKPFRKDDLLPLLASLHHEAAPAT